MSGQKKPDLAQYSYSAISSLVLTADRSAIPRRDREPDGAPESLAGRIDPREMGSRVRREAPKDVDKKKKRAAEDGTEKAPKRRAAAATVASGFGYADILEATQDVEGIRYQPRTAETRTVYELILGTVHRSLGDQTQDIVRSAADTILETLKMEGLKDFDKKKEVEDILGPMPNDQFTQLLNLSKKITDYAADDEEMKDPDDERNNAMLDDTAGVAVVWDEGEDEDDDFEIKEDSDPSDDEEEAAEPEEGTAVEADEVSLVFGGGSNRQETRDKVDSDRVSPHDIDGFWLQRLLAGVYSDPTTATEKTAEALSILSSESSVRDVENALMELLDFSHHEIVRTLVKNRDVVVWCTKLDRSNEQERMNVEVAMRERNVGWILKELRGDRTKRRVADSDSMEVDVQGPVPKTGTVAPGSTLPPRRVIDLDGMAFSQGGHLMSNKKTTLPPGTVKRTKKGYEEIHVPYKPIPTLKVDDRVPISTMPVWTQQAFPKSITHLNRVQSKLYPIAFGTDEPILLCAPTGAGKTNVAVLTILNELSKARDEETGKFALDSFKVVYIAPMKALVQEMVNDFGKRLGPFGIQVGELTGDSQMTKAQIAETQIIVTTPEKWDVITRKSTDTSYTNLVRLIIIDEIHLLHDERGPVIESIIARTIRRMEQTRDYVRLVALSATLPNYQDVARFLRVDAKKGLFFFDVTYRSRPLQQQFVGITEKKAIKRYQVMNEVCYEKVLDQAGRNQSLVFVHSRKETAKTARFIRDMAVDKETITQFVKPDSGTREILLAEISSITDPNLKDLLPFGFAIHHAGLNSRDREIVEELFKEGHLQVLVSTATLAWGVNLPAHCVIIKGTQIYNPEKGRWVELSSQDVLQMLGRAGRPQYDEYGEGIIITNHSELQYYLSLMNQQLPIESQFVAKLADNLNAEIVLGTIRNRDEAVQWLGYTYLYVRMLRDPALYSVGVDYLEDDPHLEQKRADIAHSAAVLLEKCNLVKYDRSSGRFQSTELGRIASHYYVTYNSMSTYNQHLKPTMSTIELFRVFALSNEFRLIPVRQDEKLELSKLLEKVPIPVKESVDEPAAKINVLLQAYISNLSLEGFALVADMVYVQQSAGRILRAMFEICLKRGWAIPARAALDMCKMAEKRMWSSMTPLRQFKGVPGDILRHAEAKQFPWYRYFDLSPPELGELIGVQNSGRLVHRLVHQFPKLDLQAHVQPITRSLLRIDLTITPDFQWDDRVHGMSQAFWIVVEDVDGEIILFHDTFLLRRQYATGKTEDNEHSVSLSVPMFEPVPPNYYVSVISDRWLHSETRLPISFKNLILPEKFPQPTKLLSLQPPPFSALRNAEFEKLYSESIPAFNKIQTQVFEALYGTDDNVFIGAPTGSGKTICAELALLRLWGKRDSKHPRAVCIMPYQEMVDLRVKEWTAKFGQIQGGKQIVSLTGDSSTDLRQLEIGHVIVCTPTQWDMVSRRWKKRKHVQNLALLICDEAHLVGGEIGPTYEVVISRTRYVAAQLTEQAREKAEKQGTKLTKDQERGPTRILALSVSLANARDFGEWMGAPAHAVYNFAPSARPLDLDIHLQSFAIPHFPSLMIAMSKPAYVAIKDYSPTKPVIIFAPSRRQCRLTANDILSHCLADDNQDQFLNYDPEQLKEHLNHIDDQELVETLSHGIGFYHEALSKQDKKIVERLFEAGAIQVLIASRETAWSLPVSSYMVIIMGVQYFEGREHRYTDYPVADVLQMMGHACRPTVDDRSRCVLMCQQTRKEFYRKFLNEGLPIESHLPTHLLHDFFLAEIAEETIENKQDAIDILTWTYFYRRLTQNPNYYNLNNISYQHLSDHLSELVETTLADLVTAHCISIEDDVTVSKLNLGWIAAYYNISYITIDVFSMSINERTKLKGLLEIISSSTEFETIPIRRHEDVVLRRIYDRVPVKTESHRYESPSFKAFLLLQAYFSRLQLPPDLVTDQALVLTKMVNLLHACVDVMASNAFLNAMGAMDLAQMCVQAAWESDSPLKQIPHFEPDLVKRCKSTGIDSVYDLMEMEDDKRTQLLNMTPGQLRDVATFVNSYPSLEVAHEFQSGEYVSTEAVSLKVTLSSGDEDEEDEDDTPAEPVAVAPFYPLKKIPNWWLVVGDPQTRQLTGIRRITLPKKSLTVDLKLTLAAGTHKLHLYVICDSYMGADHDIALDDITVAQGEEDDSDEDDDDSDGMEE